MQVSVVILTHNEEINLPSCLASLTGCDEVVVFDSLSTDNTVGIARRHGAGVVQRAFDNYASQRNAALALPYRHPWVLMLDADERLPADLRAEIAEVTARGADDHPVTLYRVRRKDIFLGRWLRRSSGYPTWFGRLFRVGRVRVERDINEEYHTDGEVGLLRGHLIHHPFNRGISYWFERHNRYSSLEAGTLARERAEAWHPRGLFSGDPMLRRRSFKQFAYRMPLRPVLTFVYLYFVRLGCLDGAPGFTFCVLRSIYEFMIDLKAQELRAAARVEPGAAPA